MIRLVHVAVAASIATVLAVGSAAAVDERRNDPLTKADGVAAAQAKPVSRGGTYAVGDFPAAQRAPISAPNVRVAIQWDPDIGIVRSKGVRSVRLPNNNTGLYCIRVGSAARNMVPAVTADFSPGPRDNNLFAYARTGVCNSDEIAVQTQRNTGGRPVNTDLVGFTMIAP
jgi:hypothetical protein